MVAIVVAVDSDVNFTSGGGQFYGPAGSHFGFDYGSVVGIEVVCAEVERDIDLVDAVVGKETYLDPVGVGTESNGDETDYEQKTFQGAG